MKNEEWAAQNEERKMKKSEEWKFACAQHSSFFTLRSSFKNWAASCSPALQRSTIGATGLNFSVRNGKRWDTGAIATQKWDLIQGDTRLSVCDSRSFEPSAVPYGADGDTGGTVSGAPRTKLSGN